MRRTSAVFLHSFYLCRRLRRVVLKEVLMGHAWHILVKPKDTRFETQKVWNHPAVKMIHNSTIQSCIERENVHRKLVNPRRLCEPLPQVLVALFVVQSNSRCDIFTMSFAIQIGQMFKISGASYGMHKHIRYVSIHNHWPHSGFSLVGPEPFSNRRLLIWSVPTKTSFMWGDQFIPYVWKRILKKQQK